MDVQQPESDRPEKCIFCRASKANGFDVVWEDDTFVAFRDINPATEQGQHYLVIPKRHISSVKVLGQNNVSMVKRMEEIGTIVLDTQNILPPSRRMGFHIPPFSLVHHLHLHVQGLPYKSFFRKAQYPWSVAGGESKHDKGFSWFVEVGQAIRILEKGGQIGVLPC